VNNGKADANRELTIVLITQYAEEARRFGRIVQLDNGSVVYDGPGDAWTPPRVHSENLFGSTEVSDSRTPPIIKTSALCQREQTGWPLPPSPLKDITLSVHAGDAIGMCGPIGSGKSTLAFHLAGLIPAASGSICRDSKGRDLPVVLIQFPERQLFCPTILEDVTWGPVQKGVAKDVALASAEQLLERLQLPIGDFGGRSPFALSGGQRRRAAIAGAAACRSPLYILDEPTAALDVQGTRRLEELLRDWHASQTAFIIISHDLKWLARVTTRLWVLEEGRIRFDGRWNDPTDLPPLIERLGFAAPQGG
jgi:energy-coupling factor transporter ATP-binding protein EcfA2